MRIAKSCSAYQSKKIEIGHVSGNLVKRWPPYSILRSSQPRGTKGSRAASGDIFMAEIQVIWKLSFASFSQIWWLLGCKARAIFLRVLFCTRKRESAIELDTKRIRSRFFYSCLQEAHSCLVSCCWDARTLGQHYWSTRINVKNVSGQWKVLRILCHYKCTYFKSQNNILRKNFNVCLFPKIFQKLANTYLVPTCMYTTFYNVLDMYLYLCTLQCNVHTICT